MAHLPRLFCATCGMEMVIEQTGCCVETQTANGPYYKAYSDIYQCPLCFHKVALMGPQIAVGHWQEEFDQYVTELVFEFSDSERAIAAKEK